MRYGSFSWRGQIAAIDAIDLKRNIPGRRVPNSTRYYVPRKGGYDLLNIAMCDADCRFVHYDISYYATSHGSLA
jgi:hypothetical protein